MSMSRGSSPQQGRSGSKRKRAVDLHRHTPSNYHGCWEDQGPGQMQLTNEVFNAPALPDHWSSWFSFGATDNKSTATAPRPATNRPVGDGPRRTILVVDDHRDTLRSMKLLLTRLGYDVLAAENMTDALQIANNEEFDILLSDIGLPDGSGHELIKRIREKRSVPALALSGFGMDEDLQRSLDAGFSDHLTKPVSLDRLQSAIAELEVQRD